MLFLDEISLFRRDVLESLRAPLEEGVVRLARSGGVVSYPARFSLIAASNPCPCGYAAHPRITCRCSDHQMRTHDSKLSGPLLDRIDMQIFVEPLGNEELLGRDPSETSQEIRARVEKARGVQAERYGTTTITNATVPKRELDRTIDLAADGRAYLARSIQQSNLTGRGVSRVLRVARTIADLNDTSEVDADAVSKALGLRMEAGRSI